MFKIGDTVLDDDKLSLYYGREIVISGITSFANCVVFTVVYDGNIHYALRENKVKEIEKISN